MNHYDNMQHTLYAYTYFYLFLRLMQGCHLYPKLCLHFYRLIKCVFKLAKFTTRICQPSKFDQFIEKKSSKIYFDTHGPNQCWPSI